MNQRMWWWVGNTSYEHLVSLYSLYSRLYSPCRAGSESGLPVPPLSHLAHPARPSIFALAAAEHPAWLLLM